MAKAMVIFGLLWLLFVGSLVQPMSDLNRNVYSWLNR